MAMANGFMMLENQNTSLERNKALSCLKAFCWELSQVQCKSFLVRSMSGLAMEE